MTGKSKAGASPEIIGGNVNNSCGFDSADCTKANGTNPANCDTSPDLAGSPVAVDANATCKNANDVATSVTHPKTGANLDADAPDATPEGEPSGAKPAPEDKGPTWTDMQRLAIDTRERTLLVSAAAGSGKTATLTERIIRSITDPVHPVGIDEMLIVTFTRLAAGELRERIGKAIRKEIEKNPGNPHLERQLHALPSARICTIDSFCADILRANADRVGISPTFRIPDEAECALIGENLLDGIFSAIYAGELAEVATPAALSALAECLTDTGRDTDLAAVIGAIHHTTISTIEGADSLLPLVEEYNPEKFTTVENTRFGRYIMDRLNELVAHYKPILLLARREVEEVTQTDKTKKLLDMLAEDIKLITDIEAANGYAAVREVVRAAKFSKAANNTDPTLPPTTMIHGSLRDELTALSGKFFLHTEEDWRVAYSGLYVQIGTLYRIIKHYDLTLRREKERRGICEFSDIERYTYECMWQNGERTDVARAQAKLYAQIYIDEYQDVNNLQDAIFEAISTPTSRFMVGDIKQSIYRFRSANPDIFARMKRTYPEISVAGDSPNAAIFMSDNFRCDRGIIDFVNRVFDRVFGIIGESIGYVPSDRLVCSKYKNKTEPPYRAPEVCLIDSSAIKKKHKDDPNFDAGLLTPYAVAEKIRELIEGGECKNDGMPITPGDIAIIMRTAKGRIGYYKQALDEYGIPAAVAEETKFFLTPEALLALCLLNSIDNPHRDIYLAGLMLSPLYGFTEDELTVIRRTRGGTLYESLTGFCRDNPDFEKGSKFIEQLNHYRLLSEGTPTDVLMLRLYHETGLLALAAKNGGRDRLLRLYEYARSFEASSFKGLYNFITYLNGITERKNSLDKREAPRDPHAVAILTSHGSKGLEYPVVFYVGSEEGLGGGGGAPPRFEYSEGFGIGMFLRTPSGLALVKNATKAVIADHARRLEIEEEARILYVTLTRARERLYVVANAGKKMADFDKEIAYAREYIDSYTIYNQGSLLKMMLAATDIRPTSITDFLESVPPELSLSDEMQTNIDISERPRPTKITEKVDTGGEVGFISPTDEYAGEMRVPEPYREGQIRKMLGERFSYRYPRLHLTRLPEKMSVSVLYPELLDGTDEGVVMLEEGSDTTVKEDEARLRFAGLGILPEFLTGEEKDGSAKRGIATHLLFQFCDLARLKREGARAELDHLVAERFISESDAARVRLDEVEMFRESRLIDEMMAASALYREFRFNVRLPAADFSSTDALKELYRDEEILVQGVIDCLYVDAEGEYHLIDYKTDRLTKAQLADPEKARQKMCESHARQLSYYGKAVELIFGKAPKTREVYSLHLGDTLSVM